MKLKLIIALFFIQSWAIAQFSPILSQYMFNGVVLNPGVTGAENALSVYLTSRVQWLGIPGAPKTHSFGVHSPIKNTKLSLGMQFYSDNIGVTSNNGLFGSAAYKLKFEKSDLRFGLSVGMNALKTNLTSLHPTDQLDESLIADITGFTPDASMGVYWHSENCFAGFSIPFFLQHQYNGSRFITTNDFSNYNYNLSLGGIYSFKNGIALRPSLLLKYRQYNRLQFDINLLTEINKNIQVGLSYRTEESLILLLKFTINGQASMMYSYGFPTSSLAKYTTGSHELSLKYNFLYKTQFQSPRRLL